MHTYLKVTVAVAEPPLLLRTVMLCGFDGQLKVPVDLVLPLLLSVPIKVPVAVTKTLSVAEPSVLVASTRSCFLFDVYSARVMETVSAGGGAAGDTVRAAVFTTPPLEAEIVTVTLDAV